MDRVEIDKICDELRRRLEVTKAKDLHIDIYIKDETGYLIFESDAFFTADAKGYPKPIDGKTNYVEELKSDFERKLP